MQRLQDDALLKFNPDTLVAVRRMYNLDKPGQMDEAIDILEAWIVKQPHFVMKNFPRDYLERIIIQLKGSVERAKSQLDKICTLRTMIPRFFKMENPQLELKELKGYVAQCLMPKLTEDNIRLYVWRLNAAGPHTTKRIFLMYHYTILVGEYLKSHDYCDGVSVICDMRDVPIAEFVSQINLIDLKQLITIAMEGYDIRLRHIMFLSSSKAINLLINLIKQFLTPKIAARIHVHKNVEELYEFVPRDLLPSDYGGKEENLDKLDDNTLEAFSTPEKIKYWQHIRNVCTDESRRSSKCTFDDSILGLAGTFRTLNVD